MKQIEQRMEQRMERDEQVLLSLQQEVKHPPPLQSQYPQQQQLPSLQQIQPQQGYYLPSSNSQEGHCPTFQHPHPHPHPHSHSLPQPHSTYHCSEY